MATCSQQSDHSGQAVVIRIISLCVVWFSISSTNNVVGKKILTEFPHPVTVAMVQLVSTAAFLGPTLRLWQVPRHSKIPKAVLLRLIIPLSFGKCLSVVSAHISIWRVPVSYAHTVKATMPVFTVLLSRLILQEKQEITVYLSLIPIVSGVLIATVTELSFDMIGLLSALLATLSFSLQNIFTKKAMKELHINHLRLLQILAKISIVFVLPFWALMDLNTILSYSDLREGKLAWLSGAMLVNGFLSFLQNMVAFSVLSLVSPLSYAVCTATKRIVVITVSLLMLRNPVTMTNVLGMLTAILGVLCYNKVKYECNKRKHLLPVHTNHHSSQDISSRINGYLVYNGKPYHHV